MVGQGWLSWVPRGSLKSGEGNQTGCTIGPVGTGMCVCKVRKRKGQAEVVIPIKCCPTSHCVTPSCPTSNERNSIYHELPRSLSIPTQLYTTTQPWAPTRFSSHIYHGSFCLLSSPTSIAALHLTMQRVCATPNILQRSMAAPYAIGHLDTAGKIAARQQPGLFLPSV